MVAKTDAKAESLAHGRGSGSASPEGATPPAADRRTARVTFRMTPGGKERLHRVAEERGISVSGLIRGAIGMVLARLGEG